MQESSRESCTQQQVGQEKEEDIASSNNDSKYMTYAQSVSAPAKGLNEPLALFWESNRRYEPVDGTAPLGDSLNVKDIRPEPSIILGMHPNN
jgi:hypothetical protein